MKKKNFKLVRGDDYSVKLTFSDDSGNPITVRESQLNLHARNSADELIMSLSSKDSTIQVIDDNSVSVNFNSELTQELKIETLKYDLQITTNGKRKTVLYGNIELIEDQTRV